MAGPHAKGGIWVGAKGKKKLLSLAIAGAIGVTSGQFGLIKSDQELSNTAFNTIEALQAVKSQSVNPDYKQNLEVDPSWNDIAKYVVSNTGKPVAEGIVEYLPDAYAGPKIAKMQATNPDITNIEGYALSQYIGGKYAPMNTALYGSDLLPTSEKGKFYQTLNHAANNALTKLDKATPEKVKKAFPGSNTETFNRFMSFTSAKARDDFLAQYKAGERIAYPSFTSTTVYKTLWADKADNAVLIKIKPKANTQGVLVDRFKNNMVEGEVLYPAGQKFKVSGVNVQRGKIERSMDFDYGKSALSSMTEATQKKFEAALKTKEGKKLFDDYGAKITKSEIADLYGMSHTNPVWGKAFYKAGIKTGLKITKTQGRTVVELEEL